MEILQHGSIMVPDGLSAGMATAKCKAERSKYLEDLQLDIAGLALLDPFLHQDTPTPRLLESFVSEQLFGQSELHKM